MLETEDEYHLLCNQYKLKKIEIRRFKAFIKRQSKEKNFIFDLLSRCLITAKDIYLKLYNQELGIRNIHFLDRSVDQAFDNIIFSSLKEY